MGFASAVPDATFSVHGLTDDRLAWDEKTIRWRDAPANRPGGAEVAGPRLYGQFVRRGEFQVLYSRDEGEVDALQVVIE